MFDGEDVIGIYDGNDMEKKFLTPFLDENLLMEIDGDTGALYFYFHDCLGSVVNVARFYKDGETWTWDSDKTNRYVYYAFGCKRGGYYDTDGDNTATDENHKKWDTLEPIDVKETWEPVNQDFEYTGRRFDDESGLMEYRARTYNPLLGVFLQPDKIYNTFIMLSIDVYSLPFNKYIYVSNQPIRFNDPSGMQLAPSEESYLRTKINALKDRIKEARGKAEAVPNGKDWLKFLEEELEKTEKELSQGLSKNNGEIVTEKEITSVPGPKGPIEDLCICGPDMTIWLTNKMSEALDDPIIVAFTQNRWPLYVPGVNLGWTLSFLVDFRNKVKAGGEWDLKSQYKFISDNCPHGDSCKHTVTLCGICFHQDVLGNLLYGFIGRAAGLRPSFLRWRAAAAQKHGTPYPGVADDPADVVAINIGIAMAEEGKSMCSLVRSFSSAMQRPECECVPCVERYKDVPKNPKP